MLAACSGGEPTAPDAAAASASEHEPANRLDALLSDALARAGFTGRVAGSLEQRLGRRVNPQLAEIGRLLWFDPVLAINGDNACGGCHSPSAGFGDTQPIAIGIESNRVVGPHRSGPRNQRRSPMVLNTAFYPTLMWNSRFRAFSGNPFDNSAGFGFPLPEGRSLSSMPHLLAAQAFIPPTERVEAAGFAFPGDNDAIRAEVVRRVQAVGEYRRRFARALPELRNGAPLNYSHVARSLAEFEFTLTFANAPIDRFARGERGAMDESAKRGALLFFGRAGCVKCHAVAGRSNEMFSDFEQHTIGVPQVAPTHSNVTFDGAGANEDFGLEQVTGSAADRYRFRTSPLRNVALQAAFMHNGAFVRLEDAIRHHLDPSRSAMAWTPAGLPPDLQGVPAPVAPVLARLDALLISPPALAEEDVRDLVAFVRDGLLDPSARPERLRGLIPYSLPSGMQALTFE